MPETNCCTSTISEMAVDEEAATFVMAQKDPSQEED
jgi:hypothetical protein